MSILGIPYRVFYEAKNFRTGLTDIVGLVSKPNSSMQGPYAMTELTGAFAGIYFFDYHTSEGDPEGEYLALVISPTDGIKDSKRISLYNKPQVPPPAQISGAVLSGGSITGKAYDQSRVLGFVFDDDSIQDTVEQ